MSATTNFFDENLNSADLDESCDNRSESDSSIEANSHIHQNRDDTSDSDAEIVINTNRKYEAPNGNGLPIRSISLPSCNQSSVPHESDSKPNIGTISVQNSAHPMFGNKTFYKGKITINNFVTEDEIKEGWKKSESYEHTSEEYIESNSNQPTENDKDPSTNQDQSKNHYKRCQNKKILFSVLSIFLVGLLITIILIIILSPVTSDDDNNENLDEPKPLLIISRDDWHASPPKNDLPNLELPSIRVIITDTETKNCSNQLACKKQVRKIQKMMQWIGFSDIHYNFLIGGDGAAYVGQGWDIEGDHTPGCNKKTICIAFIGNFEEEEPPQQQIKVAQKLIRECVKLNKLSARFKLYGQYQLKNTEIPNKILYEIIKKWDHWTETKPNDTNICSSV